MENRKANIIAILVVIFLIIVLLVARFSLKLSNHFYLICGADIAAILAVVTVVIVRQRFHTRRKLLESRILSEGRELRIEYSFLRKVAGVPTKFQFKELDKATDGFKSLLGKGASGSVFKGVLNDGTAVAVKRIEGGGEQGEKEFKSEVSAIASIQHVNLVRLVGYCKGPSKGPRYLVYEFFPKGSLDNWIFCKKVGSSSGPHQPHGCLSWNLRYRIALDVAKALSYLHHDCRSCILHLDIKPENILLDADFRALVSDFGLSRLKGKEESRIVTNIRGTRGYLAPEWLLENGVSEKCDVYSFGMVLLELIGGRRNIVAIEQGHDKKSKKRFSYFPKIVNEKFRDMKLMEVVDQRLVDNGDIDERQLTRMVCVALWCIQEIPRLRPSMNIVVEMLEGRVAVHDPPDTQMLVVDLLSINDDDSGIVEDGTPRFGPKAKRKNDVEFSVSAYSITLSGYSGR
ncbi:hypothetical protein Leryth_012541 [Lithospermum erythrorhizon]|nr:hypothetical protein Leryth_012541 [Lithospermum erythrorhizon]